MGPAKGSRNGNWKGGRSIASNGYVLLRVGTDHHLADVRGYAYEHRVIAEKKMGRRLRLGEIVHHKNGTRTDNRPSNLEVYPSSAHHRAKHRAAGSNKRKPDELNPEIGCRCGCGQRFLKYDGSNRPRDFVSGHNTRKRA